MGARKIRMNEIFDENKECLPGSLCAALTIHRSLAATNRKQVS
jgi:hypothetical protein